MVVPTPVTPSKQRTIPQYFVKKGALGGPRERKQTPPGVFHWPEEYDFTTTDTPPSEVATPRAQSPETVGEEDTEPTWPHGDTSDILAKINTYRFIGMSDLERRQRYESIKQTTMECTVENEGSSDTQEISGQTRDDPRPREGTAELDWRVELRDHSLGYDSLTEPGGNTGQRGGGRTITSNLRGWPDDDKTAPDPRQRECSQWRGRIDSPISHHNLWDREKPGDPKEWACDGGGTPRGDTSSRVYDGGGDLTLVTPPTWTTNRTYETSEERPLCYYKIHVDKLKLCTAATLSSDSVENLPTTH